MNDQVEVVKWVLKEGGDGLEEGLGGETAEDQEMDDGQEHLEEKENTNANANANADTTSLVEQLQETGI